MRDQPLVHVLQLQPFGEKANAFAWRMPEFDARLNILEGAVRSSKTWAMIPKLLLLNAYNVEGQRVIMGVSKATVYNNLLTYIFDMFPGTYDYNRQDGRLDWFGRKWLVFGADDVRAERYIRGLTVGVVYVEELTLIPYNVIQMLLNRLSPAQARFYATTNPDVPTHPVKTEIIDNVRLRKMGHLFVEHFELKDNPHLDEGYIEHLKAVHKGVYYQRFVLGQWVMGEGAIYKDCWSEDLLYDDEPWTMSDGRPGKVTPNGLRNPDIIAERFIAVDAGVDHAQVYGDFIDDGQDVWLDREYYWDSNAEEGFQKTDQQYGDDLEKFMKAGYAEAAQVILPPEAASFRAELIKRGMWLMNADNDVDGGIHTCTSMMGLNRFHVHRRNCPNSVNGILSYRWDPKAKVRGVEQPLKQGDDCADMIRYALRSKINTWRLEYSGKAA